LTTDCSHQKAFLLYGRGSKGKSVFLALLESLVGKANTSSERLHKLEHDKYQTAKLYGKKSIFAVIFQTPTWIKQKFLKSLQAE
jgi:phage/plasmid-associated DNA primase